MFNEDLSFESNSESEITIVNSEFVNPFFDIVNLFSLSKHLTAIDDREIFKSLFSQLANLIEILCHLNVKLISFEIH